MCFDHSVRGKVHNRKSTLCRRPVLHNSHTNCEGEASSIPFFSKYIYTAVSSRWWSNRTQTWCRKV